MMNLIFCLAISTAAPMCAPVIAGVDMPTARPAAVAVDYPIPPTLLYAAILNPAALNARQVVAVYPFALSR